MARPRPPTVNHNVHDWRIGLGSFGKTPLNVSMNHGQTLNNTLHREDSLNGNLSFPRLTGRLMQLIRHLYTILDQIGASVPS